MSNPAVYDYIQTNPRLHYIHHSKWHLRCQIKRQVLPFICESF